MDNIHKAIHDYFSQYPPLNYLFFNVNNVEDGSASIIPISGEMFTIVYIDGSGECYYDYAINVFKSVSHEQYSNENTDDLFDVQQFMEWVQERINNKDVPDLGKNYTVTRMALLQNIPTTAGEDENLVKIFFQGRIEYSKKKGKI